MNHARTRTRHAALGATVLAAAALTGCTIINDGLLDIDPGNRATQTREISDVSAVVLATSGSLRISVGDEPSLTISAGEAVLERLTTEIDGETLVIDLPGPWGGNLGRIEYDLVLPALDTVSIPGSGEVTGELAPADRLTIDISGSGDVRVDPVDVSDVAVTIAGSGSVTLEGRTSTLAVSIPGSGDFTGANLAAATAVVSISGSGEAGVNVTRTLDASISGSGEITYLGDPSVTSNVTGSGDIGAA
jgi:hypothetical protein